MGILPAYERRPASSKDLLYRSNQGLLKRLHYKRISYQNALYYFIEDLTGYDMKYYYGTNISKDLLKTGEMEIMRDHKNDELELYVLNGTWAIDEMVSLYSGHTLLHEAITCHNPEGFKFLTSQKANWMARDRNGYTPLLKAASWGFLDMVQGLVEAGVDPRHTDTFGNTPLDKAKLYEHQDVIEYLEEVIQKVEKQEEMLRNGEEIDEKELIKFLNWEKESLDHRGRFRTYFDYRSW